MTRFLLGAMLAATGLASQGADTYLLAPDVSVEGRSQADWSQAWWQWAGSFEDEDSPVADRTGALCASGQKGQVWFLAGTYGTKRTVRTCKVPRDKHLFFPLINYVVMQPDDHAVACMAVTTEARRMTQNATNLIVEIDGVRHTQLQGHRQATRQCFDMGALADPPVRVFPSAANGYYVMLKPLPPGRHVLNFGGALPSMLQAVTYTLIVE